MNNLVAIVGKPNVGKSTLFNRLIGKRLSIVDDKPGITRDRLYHETKWNNFVLNVIDTGGIEIANEGFQTQIRIQTQIAIEEAKVILFVVDGRHDLTSDDLMIATQLRKQNKPVILVANKLENNLDAVASIFALGMNVFTTSALHGEGVGDLLDAICLNFEKEDQLQTKSFKIAIIGRPNVGKSSLLNLLVKKERSIVSPIANTTRDAVVDTFKIKDELFTIIDTAGINRKSKLVESVEHYALNRAMLMIENASLVLLMLDAQNDVSHFDAVIGSYIDENRKPVIIVVNKWDLIQKETQTMQLYNKKLYKEFKFLDYAPIVYISVQEKQRIKTLEDAILKVKTNMARKIKTNVLNDFINETQMIQPPPTIKGKRLQIYFIKQIEAETPTFALFVNHYKHLHFSYERFLENQLRKSFDFEGAPIKLLFRNKKGDSDE